MEWNYCEGAVIKGNKIHCTNCVRQVLDFKWATLIKLDNYDGGWVSMQSNSNKVINDIHWLLIIRKDFR